MLPMREFLKATTIYLLASSLPKISGLILLPIYTRIFTPYQYGLIDLIAMIISFASLFGLLQLESAMARFYHEAIDEGQRKLYVSTITWTVVALSIGILILLILFAYPLANWIFNDKSIVDVIRLAALSIPFANLFTLGSILLRFEKKSLLFGIVSIIQMVVMITGTLWFILVIKNGIFGVYAGQFLGWLVGSLAMFFFAIRRYLIWQWDRATLWCFLKYSLPQVPSVGGTWLNVYANRFVMLTYLTVNEIGIFAVASKVVSIFSLLDNAFRMAWYPFFMENLKQPDHKKFFRKMFFILSLSIFFLVGIFSLTGNYMLHWFATPAYLGASRLLGIMGFSAGLFIILQLIGFGPDICKKMGYNTMIGLITTGANIAFLFFLVPNVGLLGVPIGQLFSGLIALILSWFISERLYPIGFKQYPFFVALLLTLTVVIWSFLFLPNVIYNTLIALYFLTGLIMLGWFELVKNKSRL